jgi:hypothetical protein
MTYGLMRVVSREIYTLAHELGTDVEIASVYAAGKQDEFRATIDNRLLAMSEVFTALFQQLNVSDLQNNADAQSDSLLPNNMLETNATQCESRV